MKLTTREQECITHRLEIPDTIWDFMQTTEHGWSDMVTEEEVEDACESLTKKLIGEISLEDLTTLEKWLLTHCIRQATWHLGFCAPVGERVLERCAAKVETLLILNPGTLDVPPKLSFS